MTAVLAPSSLVAPLDLALEAHEPPEVRGRDRADVRLLVSHGAEDVAHGRFADLPASLRRGDVVVVNSSATIPAAIGASLPDGAPVAVHCSTEMPGGFWLVEVRRPASVATQPLTDDLTGSELRLTGGGRLTLLDRLPGSQRLWLASLHLDAPVLDYLDRHGEPIRYRHAPAPWPISAYQQIFGVEPGSAEMPSAARPFTSELLLDLVRRGVTIATILLHAGVSSLEAHEMPYPERYSVSDTTAAHLNATRQAGGRRDRGRERPSSARSRRSSTGRARCTPAMGGPTSWSPPSAASAGSTASSPDGTNPKPAIC